LNRNSCVVMVVALLTFIAIGRILLTYRVTSVAWDEPCHIAAGVEWIDRGTYTLDPLHPPLSRLAIGLPLYLAGARIPQFPDQNLRHHDYYEVGTRILYDGGHYYRNLVLARLGVLPFFIFTTVLVFWWTRQIFGVPAALASVVLFTTTPSILAFAGLAYTDMTTACMQFATLFALATWMQKPNRVRTVLLGLALGLALLSKMTTLLYLPACAVGILLSRWMVGERREPLPKNGEQIGPQQHWKSKLGISLAIAVVVLWGGYRFSIGHVQEDMGLSPQAMPSFQHFPAPVRGLARRAIISDWVVPAPALIQGLSDAWVVNKMRLPSYMWGTTTNGGAWYFFFVALAVKAPLPLLVLWVAGVFFLLPAIRRKEWMPLIPATAVFMVLLVAITVQYKEGVRHILVVFPLLAVVAGHGVQALWSLSGGWRVIGKAVVVSLLAWQCVSSVRAGRDFISYYNVLAGSDPSKVYFTGCDLDCGQDIYRLAQEVRKRNIPALRIAAWSSSDIYQMELPKVELLEPYQPVTGWVAISVRSLRLAQTFHKTYPVDAFSWLDQYKPVQQVGRTMFLYHIPASNQLPSTSDATLPGQARPTGS
jgi:Dolichyl-phosphate-mannose-protein mannosyltransferase